MTTSRLPSFNFASVRILPVFPGSTTSLSRNLPFPLPPTPAFSCVVSLLSSPPLLLLSPLLHPVHTASTSTNSKQRAFDSHMRSTMPNAGFVVEFFLILNSSSSPNTDTLFCPIGHSIKIINTILVVKSIFTTKLSKCSLLKYNILSPAQ